MKIKENETRDKSLDFKRELKKPWNMKLTSIPIVIFALGTIPKELVRELEDLEIGGRAKIIQIILLLWSANTVRIIQELWGILLWKTIGNISNEKTWTWFRKRNFKRETESLQIASQNIRTNYIKARIDKTQQNSKCRLRGDRDETINHIISECSKLAQKEYKSRHDWIGKVIHWEMCKKFIFDHTNKWYMHNLSPVLENNTNKLLWDFDIHTDYLISARRPDLIIINKKKRTCKIVDFAAQLTTE